MFWSTISTDVDALRLVGCTYNRQALYSTQSVRLVCLEKNIAEFNMLDKGLFSFTD